MGCQPSINKSVRGEWLDLFRKMQLNKSEIRILYKLHNQYQTRVKGNLDIVEWLTLIDLERTTLTERLFAASDRDGDGLLNFYEFVISLWKFCILGDHSLNVFAFDMYDTDASGVLSNEDVHIMFADLLGKKLSHTDTNKFVLGDWMKHSTDGSMTIEQFVQFSKTHQALLKDVFTVQRRMRKRTFGIEHWHGVSKRMIELAPGRRVQLCELMVLHSDHQLFEALLLDRNTRLHLSTGTRAILEITENAHPDEEDELIGNEQARPVEHVHKHSGAAHQPHHRYSRADHANPHLQHRPYAADHTQADAPPPPPLTLPTHHYEPDKEVHKPYFPPRRPSKDAGAGHHR